MRSARSSPSVVLATTAGALLLASCGDAARVDRDDYRSVYSAAMAAVAAKDLDALWPLLTDRARQGVEREMRAWQAMLRDPGTGPRILTIVRERRSTVTAADLDRVAKGSVRDAWTLYLEAEPRSPTPKRAGTRACPERVTILYEAPYGASRAVELIRRPGGWFVDLLQL